jgi:hypothetical protein
MNVKGVSHSVLPITIERLQPTSGACSCGLDRYGLRRPKL